MMIGYLIIIGVVLLIVVGPSAFGMIFRQIEKRAIQQAQSKVEQVASQRDIAGLGALLIDPDGRVREAAANALEQLGVPDDKLIRARYLVAKKNFDLAASLGDVSVEPLILTLNHSDTMVRSYAASALARIGDLRAVQPLIDAVKGLDMRAIGNIATPLGTFKDPRAVDQLIVALNNKNPHVRWVAAAALGEIGEPKALSELERVAREDKGETYDNGTVKDAAREAVGKIRMYRHSVEELIATLNDSDAEHRYYAVNALGKSGDARCVEPLIAVLRDPSEKVREAVVEALGVMGDKRALDPLMAIVTSKDDTVKWNAVNAMHKIAGPPVEALIALLSDTQPFNQVAAIKRLGAAGDPRALPALERIAREKQNKTQDTLWDMAEEARQAIAEIRRLMQNE